MKEWWILYWDEVKYGGMCGICGQPSTSALRLFLDNPGEGQNLVDFLRDQLGVSVLIGHTEYTILYLLLCTNHQTVITDLTTHKLLTEAAIRAAIST